MTMLLPTFQAAQEADAIAFARNFVATCREGEFLDLGFPPLHAEVSRAFAQHMIKQAMRDANVMLQIIDAAYLGWRDGREALDGLILELTNAHQTLPAFLAEYNARRVKGVLPARLRGRRRSSNLVQDMVAMTLILELITRFHLSPTRRQTGRKRAHSACSIASLVMTEAGLHRGGETAMEAIWWRYKASVLPGHRAEAVLATKKRHFENVETSDAYRLKEIP
jgi:hypothetical protein